MCFSLTIQEVGEKNSLQSRGHCYGPSIPYLSKNYTCPSRRTPILLLIHPYCLHFPRFCAFPLLMCIFTFLLSFSSLYSLLAFFVFSLSSLSFKFFIFLFPFIIFPLPQNDIRQYNPPREDVFFDICLHP